MPVSEKKLASNRRYNATCDSIQIRPQKERGQEIRRQAEQAGMSLQGYILTALEEKKERDSSDYYKITIPKTKLDTAAAKAGKTPKELITDLINTL